MALQGLSLNEKFSLWLGRCKRNENGCLIWPGVKSKGYAAASYQNRPIRISRLLLERKLGRPLKPKHLACHSCDNRACLNEEHLFEGTYGENNRDSYRKGRRRGWTHHATEIRLIAEGRLKQHPDRDCIWSSSEASDSDCSPESG